MRFRDSTGSTLAELLVASGILIAVGAMTASVVAQGVRTFERESTWTGFNADLTSGEAIVLEELRMAGYSPDGASAVAGTFTAVTTGTTSDSVQFVADVDSDGVSERITYGISSGNLERTEQEWSGSAWNFALPVTIAEAVSEFRVTFLDEDRNILTGTQVVAQGTGLARFVRVEIGLEGNVRLGDVAADREGEIAFRN